jgi:DNA-binding NarL/FixJ family response regulator
MNLASHAEPRQMVIYQPANLCAEAVAAAIHKHTQWKAVCATTHVGEATAAASRCHADALLFEVRSGSAAAVAALIQTLRNGCRGVPLVLLTQHAGAGFRRAAAAARLAAIIDKREPIDVLKGALRAIEQRSGQAITCGESARLAGGAA